MRSWLGSDLQGSCPVKFPPPRPGPPARNLEWGRGTWLGSQCAETRSSREKGGGEGALEALSADEIFPGGLVCRRCQPGRGSSEARSAHKYLSSTLHPTQPAGSPLPLCLSVSSALFSAAAGFCSGVAPRRPSPLAQNREGVFSGEPFPGCSGLSAALSGPLLLLIRRGAAHRMRVAWYSQAQARTVIVSRR